MTHREEQIKILRETVRENRGICAIELEELTGIDITLIMDLINNGDLTLKEDKY